MWCSPTGWLYSRKEQEDRLLVHNMTIPAIPAGIVPFQVVGNVGGWLFIEGIPSLAGLIFRFVDKIYLTSGGVIRYVHDA